MQTATRDRQTIIFAATAAFMMVAHLQGGKTVRDALFLSHFAVTALPKMMIAAALVSAAAVAAFSLLLTRYGPTRLTPPMFLFSGLLSVGEWIIMEAWPHAVTVLLYLHITVLDALLISGFWSILNERYDPYRAKTIIGRVVIFTALGGLAGAGAASIIARALDIRMVIVMLAALHLGSGLALLPLARDRFDGRGPSSSLLAPFRISVRNKLIQRVALLMVALSATVALLDYLFKATLQSNLNKDELVTFFAYFYMAVDIGTFLLQTFVGRKALHWFGLGGTIALVPLSLFSGALLTFVFRSLMTVTMLRAAANLLTNSFFGPGYELLYTPIATAEKRTSKILIDVGANRAGNMLGGLVIMGLLFVPGPTHSYILFSTMICAGIMGLLIFLLSRGYLSQLVTNLQEGHLPARSAVTPGPAESPAAATSTNLRRERLLRRIAFYRQVNRSPAVKPGPPSVTGERPRPPSVDDDRDPEIEAIRALRSGEDRRIRHVLVNQAATPGMLPHILPLLRHRSVLKEALAACRPLAATASGQLVDALLDQHQHALVRRRIPLLLGFVGNMQAVHGLIAGLEDRAPDVRYRCAEALARIKTDYPHLTIDSEAVWRVIYREMTFLGRSNVQPRQGVEPLRHLFHLLGLIFGVQVMDVCYDSLQAPETKIRGTALEYLENRLPPNVKSALWPIIATGRADHMPSNRTAEEILEELWGAQDVSSQRSHLLERSITPKNEPDS